MRRVPKIALAAGLLLAVIAAGAAALLRRGYSARAEPSALEAAIARRLRGLATPRNAAALANPVPRTPEAIASGRAHFADHCAVCHANDGSGDTLIGQGLYPRPPDMRAAPTQRLSDGELFYIIRNGVRFTGMPGWGSGPEHEDRDSWTLVHFIRHLPGITAEELAQMERLNPRPPSEAAASPEASPGGGHHHGGPGHKH